MLNITRQFEAWARTKPADEAYNPWTSKFGPSGCAVSQFLHARGIEDQSVWSQIHDLASDALFEKPFTFGCLADRLAKVSGQ